MADELRLRREKQYELLEKIQGLEEAVNDRGNRLEEVEPQLRALQQRNLDLEAQVLCGCAAVWLWYLRARCRCSFVYVLALERCPATAAASVLLFWRLYSICKQPVL
jgi:hypothetical protein